MSFDPLAHPIVYTEPDLLTPRSTWAGHIPLAFLLVDLLRPRTFVELGTLDGVSYLAFCKAVQLLATDTKCVAIDTWAGDAHEGYYGPEVLANLKQFHDPRYSGFSRLLQADFASAAPSFADGSIDLLHIDGLHTYEAVRGDFTTYYPKMSDRGVVVFHDSNARMRDFGVYRLIEELAPRYRHFEFLHAYGLAVLLIGAAVPAPMIDFINAANAAPDAYRALFSRLGEHWEIARIARHMIGAQFQQMQAINELKVKIGMAVDPTTQRLELAMNHPLPFADHTIREMSALFRRIQTSPPQR